MRVVRPRDTGSLVVTLRVAVGPRCDARVLCAGVMPAKVLEGSVLKGPTAPGVSQQFRHDCPRGAGHAAGASTRMARGELVTRAQVA